DLDLAHVAAVGKILDRRIVDRGGDEPGLHAFRQPRRVGGVLGYLLDGGGAIRPRRREHAVGEFHVLDRDAEPVRGDARRLVENLPARAVERGARKRRRTRAAGALAEEQLVGIALQILHLGRIEAEAVAHDLFEYGLVALALAHAAGEHRRSAGAVEAD